MKTRKQTARLAGFLYLLVVIFGIFSLMYVPSKLIDADMAVTIQNIKNSELLFRLGAISGLFSYTAFLFLPFVLYRLFREVDHNHATIMLILAVVSVPISYMTITNMFDVISLIENSDMFEQNELLAQVKFSFDKYWNGVHTAQFFWATWLFPYGYLTYKSGFLPKAIGVILMVGSVGYFGEFLAQLLIANYHNLSVSQWITIPASVGEIGSCLWLLIMGARNPKNGPV